MKLSSLVLMLMKTPAQAHGTRSLPMQVFITSYSPPMEPQPPFQPPTTETQEAFPLMLYTRTSLLMPPYAVDILVLVMVSRGQTTALCGLTFPSS